jgi:hypothetical protein
MFSSGTTTAPVAFGFGASSFKPAAVAPGAFGFGASSLKPAAVAPPEQQVSGSTAAASADGMCLHCFSVNKYAWPVNWLSTACELQINSLEWRFR